MDRVPLHSLACIIQKYVKLDRCVIFVIQNLKKISPLSLIQKINHREREKIKVMCGNIFERIIVRYIKESFYINTMIIKI